MLRKEKKRILIGLSMILILCILGFMQSAEAVCRDDMPALTNLFIFYWGIATVNGEEVQEGDEIRAYVDDVVVNGGCIGLSVVEFPGYYGPMALYGDDVTTPEKDGAQHGDTIHFVHCRDGVECEFEQTSVWDSANILGVVELNLICVSGCTVYYRDLDQDSYGVDDDTQCLLAPEEEYTATQGGDCNDENAEINPGAQEICDGRDNDCDGMIDEGFDADGDGYTTCGGDCDDTDPTIYPGTAKAIYITYNGDAVIKANDYSVDPPTGDVNVSALLTDFDYQIIEGWEIIFEIYDIENNLVASVSAFTDSSGIAQDTVQDLPIGVYDVDITFIGDDCFYYSSNSHTVIAVYDPAGGFAAGGGWYTADEEVTGLSGRANFGLNVKYRQDESTGTLEFQFGTGDLNLKSTNIDWLVISESNAHFKGQGKNNNIDGYFFRVIAMDFGEPGVGIDELYIKIWDGDPDNQDSSLIHSSKKVLGGGNITVRTNKIKRSSKESDPSSFSLPSIPSLNMSSSGMPSYSLPSLSTPLYNTMTSYDMPLLGYSRFFRSSIPSLNISPFGMLFYSLPQFSIPVYNNITSYYMQLLDISSFELPFYAICNTNMIMSY